MHFVLLLNFVLISKAAVLPWMRPRGVPVSCQTSDENIALAEFNDGPTTSGEAGIGAEFETIDIQFTNAQCSLEDTFMAKRKTVKGHSGKNFVLSVDTSVEQGKGTLSAEYVLDGRNIKVGDGSATVAGKAVHDDLVSAAETSSRLDVINVHRRVGSLGVKTPRTRSPLRTTSNAQIHGLSEVYVKTQTKIQKFVGYLKSPHRCLWKRYTP
jgi:hypothetical protein